MGSRQIFRITQTGSFTVETALLMGIILPVLICVLIAGLYLHDKIYLAGAGHEAVSMSVNLKEDQEESRRAETIYQKRITGGILWGRNVKGSLTAGEDLATAFGEGKFPAGPAMPRFSYLFADMSAETRHAIYDPAGLIWKVRSARFLIEQFLAE